jgi:ribosomal peptide maturation radical SAM protein 1
MSVADEIMAGDASPRTEASAIAIVQHLHPRTALVCMPFVSAFQPSIQVALLKAIAERHGFSVSGFHFNLDFARLVGVMFYEALCEVRQRRDGDWMFAREAFGADAPDIGEQYTEVFADSLTELATNASKQLEDIVALRQRVVPAFLDYLVEKVAWSEFDVVGFTSTFQQNTASIALARRLKEKFPKLITLFGGANFEGDMGFELTRKTACVDYAVVGEADEAFPAFLSALRENRDPLQIPGVVAHAGGASRFVQPRPFMGMESSPIPDFTDYFSQARELQLLDKGPTADIPIPFESSRGCWWGEKQHCVFCGLNGATMKFRAKSADKVLNEISELTKRHGSFYFVALDNILPTNYFTDLVDRIAEEGGDLRFFYELKSNLNRDRIRRLWRGGVRMIQPGIESLSSEVLRLMRKGVTGIQNVNTLRWCRYYGIEVAWNLLYGFPGETAQSYAAQFDALELLAHLQPPGSCGRIWMERFSPIFTDAGNFPRKQFHPEASYSYIYPESFDLEKVAYFFDYEFEGALPEEVYEPTKRLADAWQRRWQQLPRPSLTYKSMRDFVEIDDQRGEPGRHTLEGDDARIYLACSDHPRSATSLSNELSLGISPEAVLERIGEFVERGVMIGEGPLFLSLALPWTQGR